MVKKIPADHRKIEQEISEETRQIIRKPIIPQKIPLYFNRTHGVKVGPDEDLLLVGAKNLNFELDVHPEFKYVTENEIPVLNVRNKYFKKMGIGTGPATSHGARGNTNMPLGTEFRIRASIPGDEFVYLIDTRKGLAEFLNLATSRGYGFKMPRHWGIKDRWLTDEARRLIYFANKEDLGKL